MSNHKQLRKALDYLGGARFANYSGQVVEQTREGKDNRILFELGCVCGEVGSKNADEYAEILVTLLNGAGDVLSDLDAYQSIVSDVLDEVQAELRAGAVFENMMLAVASRIALAWIEPQRRKAGG